MFLWVRGGRTFWVLVVKLFGGSGRVVLWLKGKGWEGKESEVEVRLRAWVV